jgi:hypothetical protein
MKKNVHSLRNAREFGISKHGGLVSYSHPYGVITNQRKPDTLSPTIIHQIELGILHIPVCGKPVARPWQKQDTSATLASASSSQIRSQVELNIFAGEFQELGGEPRFLQVSKTISMIYKYIEFTVDGYSCSSGGVFCSSLTTCNLLDMRSDISLSP